MGFQKGWAIVCTLRRPQGNNKATPWRVVPSVYAKPWDVLADKPVDPPVERYLRPISTPLRSDPPIVWANLMPAGIPSILESHVELPGLPAFLSDNINRVTMSGIRLSRVNVSQEHGARCNRRNSRYHPTIEKIKFRQIGLYRSIRNGDLLGREKLNRCLFVVLHERRSIYQVMYSLTGAKSSKRIRTRWLVKITKKYIVESRTILSRMLGTP